MFFKKIPVTFGLCFGENSTSKLGTDHDVREEIAATDGQLLLN